MMAYKAKKEEMTMFNNAIRLTIVETLSGASTLMDNPMKIKNEGDSAYHFVGAGSHHIFVSEDSIDWVESAHRTLARGNSESINSIVCIKGSLYACAEKVSDIVDPDTIEYYREIDEEAKAKGQK